MLPGMSVPESMASPPDAEVPDHLVEAGRYASDRDAFEHGLVILAAGHSCWLVPRPGSHQLLVEPATLDQAREQLLRFDRESLGWPPAAINLPFSYPLDLLTPLIWAVLVLALFTLQIQHPEWMAYGALDATAVVDGGEWWRTATALFLHGDAAHVLSNVLGGTFAFAALITTVGRGRAWLWLAVTSVWANAILVTIHYPAPYRSLGASTAVFAAIGLLAGRAAGILFRVRRHLRRREILVPIASGAIVLALYGAGGFRVDVGAHVIGFTVGCAVGVALGLGGEKRG